MFYIAIVTLVLQRMCYLELFLGGCSLLLLLLQKSSGRNFSFLLSLKGSSGPFFFLFLSLNRGLFSFLLFLKSNGCSLSFLFLGLNASLFCFLLLFLEGSCCLFGFLLFFQKFGSGLFRFLPFFICNCLETFDFLFVSLSFFSLFKCSFGFYCLFLFFLGS